LNEKLDSITKEKLNFNMKKSDLENFFMECIKTVRK